MKRFFMFSKVLVVLLALLMSINVPVYAEKIYTLKAGNIYKIELDLDYPYVDVVFSDNVLHGDYSYVNTDIYDWLYIYDIYEKRYQGDVDTFNRFLYVYNISDSDVIMTKNDGVIKSIKEYQSPFGLVMYDATNTEFEVEYVGNRDASYYMLIYDENDRSLRFSHSSYYIAPGDIKKFEGKGVLIFDLYYRDVFEDVMQMNGDYKMGNNIEYNYFYKVPWKLGIDLNGIIQILWEQLKMLLPAGLVVLSIMLIMYLTRYVVRLFL